MNSVLLFSIGHCRGLSGRKFNVLCRIKIIMANDVIRKFRFKTPHIFEGAFGRGYVLVRCDGWLLVQLLTCCSLVSNSTYHFLLLFYSGHMSSITMKIVQLAKRSGRISARQENGNHSNRIHIVREMKKGREEDWQRFDL